MTHRIDTTIGSITLSDSLVSNLAGMATTECYGVAGMASQNLQDGLSAALGQRHLARGVRVQTLSEEDGLAITVNIIVGYGVNIAEVARNIREKVRYVVGHCTGIPVLRVDVHVRGVKVTHIHD